jgi:YaaC-like protein
VGLIDLHWIGSFQNGINEWSESPLEDVWKRIALFSYPDHLRTVFTAPKLSPEAKAVVENYASTRIRQATEFREASRAGSLLTAPLPLYYSFLNLTRAFIAVEIEATPTERGHGLTFKEGASSVLESTGTVASGTFHEWLTELGVRVPLKTAITLDECLSGIVELGSDYIAVTGKLPRAIPVYVQGMHSGAVTLHFDGNRLDAEHFRKHWRQEFPSVANTCSLEPQGCVLKVNADVDTKTYEAVCRYCADHLEVNLIPTSRPTWHLLRQQSGHTLPRPAYYFCALFILGSIVRYEPESLMTLTAQPSSVAWLLDRLLKTAERFYPNLMLNWAMKKPWFFGAVSA